MKYKLVDGAELGSTSSPEAIADGSTEPNPTAGATLLKFVQGKASVSEVMGKAKGEELMQFLKGPGSPSNAQTKENEDFNIFNKLTVRTEQPEPEHHVWALNKILTTKLPTEEFRWDQQKRSDQPPWKQSKDDINWDWEPSRKMNPDSWQTWDSGDSWGENDWPWSGRVCPPVRPDHERLNNGLPDGVHEARRYKDGNMYVIVGGHWYKASAQYYCERCQLFGNQINEHLESNHHKRNIGRY